MTGKAVHCSFAKGECEVGADPNECPKHSTVFCRNQRNRNEAKENEKDKEKQDANLG